MITIAGVAIFFVNILWSLFAGKKAPDNPWGEGATTLEWTLSSPPPFHQFSTLPKIDVSGRVTRWSPASCLPRPRACRPTGAISSR